MRNLKHVLVAATVVTLLLGSVPVHAQLPGLPAAKPQADGNGEGARPGGNHPTVVNQTTPVRGSLFKQGVAGPESAGYSAGGGGGGNVSFIAVTPAEPKRYRKNDVLTVVISEASDTQINGTNDSKKTQDFDFAIQQFLQLALSQSGVPTVGTVGNPSNLPEIKFKYSNDRKADANQQRSDSFTARVTATVVDVKPNGTLVIEAVKQILVDKEMQIFKLSGICRVEDIQVDNTVLSTQLANLAVSKQTSGEVRDSTKRGWLNQWLDKWNPF